MASIKPMINLGEIAFDQEQACGRYTFRRGHFSSLIAARNLGYNLTEVPPNAACCPFHCHHGAEEMFLILEGEGLLRFGKETYPLRAQDVIACPPGGAEVAHQIINTGKTILRYLAISTKPRIELCEYPDSGKIAACASEPDGRTVYRMFPEEADVDYYDREALDGFDQQSLPANRNAS